MSLALIGARTATHQLATNLSGFVNTVGYLVAGVGPVVTGLLHEITGQWGASLFFLAALSLFSLPAAAVFAREHTVEEELAGSAQN
jgi:CP family cyanate transporter-like MFS transporter